MPDWIQEIIRQQMRKDKVFIDLAKDMKSKAAKTIDHYKIDIRNYDKLQVLSDICKLFFIISVLSFAKNLDKTLVFCSTKAETNELTYQRKKL